MNIYALIPLISCIAYMLIIGATIWLTQRKIRDIFLIYLVVAMLWSFFSFQLHWNHFTGYHLLWHKFLVILIMLVPISYYHFVSAFIRKRSVQILWSGYGLLMLFAIFTFGGYVIKSSEVGNNGLLYYDLGAMKYLMFVFGTSFMVITISLLAQHYRKSVDPQVRNRTVYLLIGATIVLSFALTNLSSSLTKYPIDHIGNLINALITTYVVVKYNLLDIRVTIGKGLAYSGFTLGLISIYIIFLYIIESNFTGWGYYSALAFAAALSILIAISIQRWKKVSQQWVDKLFYRETYVHRQTLLHFSQRMSNILNLNELAENMLPPLTKGLYAAQAFLFLPEADTSDFVSRFTESLTVSAINEMRLRIDNPIVLWLVENKRILTRENIEILPEFKSLWSTEKEEIDSLGIQLFCPIRRNENLICILALSGKQSHGPYSNADIDLLTTMTTESAKVIENAMILDNVKDQQRRVERLLARTVQAREEERKSISRELHDSVAQWLVGTSYRVQAFQSILSKTDNSHETQVELEEIQDTIDKSLKELRRIMVGLRPPVLDGQGLSNAIQKALGELKTDGIVFQFKIKGDPLQLSSSTELAVYRIVQEAISNVKKHSEASAVILQLHFRSEDVLVEISDNGKGFLLSNTMRSAHSAGHMGLIGMKERAMMIGGTLDIKTGVGSGTTINLVVPIISVAMTGISEDNQKRSQNTDKVGGKDHGNDSGIISR